MKREDVLLGVASIFIAVLMWFQVQPLFEPGREREFNVIVRLENRPAELYAFPEMESVTVVASGTLQALNRLETSRVEAVVDLAKLKEGSQRVPISIRAPADAQLEFRTLKPAVLVRAEKVESAEREVKIVTTGTPIEGLRFEGASTQPERVVLSGPVSMLSRVAQVQVTLDLPAARPGTTVSRALEILDKEGQPVPAVTAEPGKVTVSPAVVAAPASRDVPVIVEWSGSAAPGFQLGEITVIPQRIPLNGPSEIVSQLTAIRTEALAISALRESRTFEVKLVIPEGTTSDQSTVTVRVQVVKR